MDSQVLVEICVGCPTMDCFGCAVESMVNELLTSDKVLDGVLRDIQGGYNEESR